MTATTGHVVIVGAGLSGLSTAEALRAGAHPGPITLIGGEADLPYDRPPLSKEVLRGERQSTALRMADWFAEQGITLLTGTTVAGIDPDSGTVDLPGRRLTADMIVLATGGTPRRLPGGVNTLPTGHPALHELRTVADCRRLTDALRPGTKLAVIGAGLIGAEAAASAVARGCHVDLIDPNELPLAAAIGPEAATLLHRRHAAHGVTTHQAGVEHIHAADNDTVRIVLSTGDTIAADALLVGIGITADTALAEAAGLAVDNGILVDSRQRTSHPRVMAVGDASRRHGPDGPLPRVEHWDHALRSGQTAAATILDTPEQPPRAPWFWSDRYDIHLEMVGHLDPRAQSAIRLHTDDELSIFYLRDGRCIGAVTVNQPLDARAAQRLIDQHIPVTADQLTDPAVSLRQLVRGR
ncbi:NADPH-dependent 2,4-dienoyl-CoA reductase/sulfur reductase-like enzyme [Allocatelliglobosispora scoriae]|uniref:NADPH-dependent 2,4-dienoyl-CoA reductase/sulfur reductase-like enzyme n=1 Tax=Allocatelliglobosispora scoriae TaxID=643052 RepID=A0A841BLF0_9ACTN|nr:FAD-dependent oxidoreductase [Allocatelliglobosispora scoriae]MBB5868076.1 NADPH-dependent 2,4-dienoyl-CoA reductase/sulfur reductase-like enzyme [Allocatelliglobosispora scoriae]